MSKARLFANGSIIERAEDLTSVAPSLLAGRYVLQPVPKKRLAPCLGQIALLCSDWSQVADSVHLVGEQATQLLEWATCSTAMSCRLAALHLSVRGLRQILERSRQGLFTVELLRGQAATEALHQSFRGWSLTSSDRCRQSFRHLEDPAGMSNRLKSAERGPRQHSPW